MARCDMCFKEKSPLQAPVRGILTQVCKGCFYEIDRVIGFLQHYGFTIMGQGALPIKPPKPPRPPRSSITDFEKNYGRKPKTKAEKSFTRPLSQEETLK